MKLKELKNIIDKIYEDVCNDDIDIEIINQRADIIKIKTISLKKSYTGNETTLEIKVINL